MSAKADGGVPKVPRKLKFDAREQPRWRTTFERFWRSIHLPVQDGQGGEGDNASRGWLRELLRTERFNKKTFREHMVEYLEKEAGRLKADPAALVLDLHTLEEASEPVDDRVEDAQTVILEIVDVHLSEAGFERAPVSSL